MDKEYETRVIEALEARDTSGMDESAYKIHLQDLKDAYWRRRMATRTDDEVARGVIAP